MVKKQQLSRMKSMLRKIIAQDQSFREVKDMNKNEYNIAMGTRVRTEKNKEAQLKLIKQIAENKEVIIESFKKDDPIYDSPRMEQALRDEINARCELTDEHESYYSVHLTSHEKNAKGKSDERHIFAPTLKRINEIIAILEEKYGFTYRQDHIKIIPYKEFLDKQREEEIERRLNV